MGDLKTARAATTQPVRLQGFQIVDGVLLSVGDNVLVKDQEDEGENGVYSVADGQWLLIYRSYYPTLAILAGTVNGGTKWHLSIIEGGVLRASKLLTVRVSNPAPPQGRDLSFDDLRGANRARLPTFKNAKGEPAHDKADGSDWCLAQWCNAMTGEVGETANLIKKIERGDFTLEEARPELAKELADVACYLDLLAMRAGVDLGQAIQDKFNEVSVRVGSPVRLQAGGHYFTDREIGKQS